MHDDGTQVFGTASRFHAWEQFMEQIHIGFTSQFVKMIQQRFLLPEAINLVQDRPDLHG